jgi:hypothetical protein
MLICAMFAKHPINSERASGEAAMLIRRSNIRGQNARGTFVLRMLPPCPKAP